MRRNQQLDIIERASRNLQLRPNVRDTHPDLDPDPDPEPDRYGNPNGNSNADCDRHGGNADCDRHGGNADCDRHGSNADCDRHGSNAHGDANCGCSNCAGSLSAEQRYSSQYSGQCGQLRGLGWYNDH
jgi:hypothetical protein